MTHGGRHASAMEAEGSGIPFDLIKREGGWKDRLGRLETHYLGKLPSSFARGMAGFWEKPFSLARNNVSPTLELQRMVFPWIESYFGEGNLEWEAVCEKEMKEIDENEDEDDNIFNLDVENEADPIEFVEEDGRMILKEPKGKGKQKAVQSSIDTAKRGFLRLLIRCRRIILQDAAVYLYFNKQNKHVNTSSPIFSSYRFRMFQEDAVAAITSPTIGRLEEYEGLVPNIVDTSKQVATRIAEVNHRVMRLQQQQDQRFEKNESSFNNCIEQNNQQNVLLMNMNQQLARDVKIIMMQQQCLNAQMQLFMATNNASQNQNFSNSLPQPPNISTFPAIPPMQPFSFSAPPIPQTTTQPPVAISPALHSNNDISNISTSSKPRPKKKARWVSYEPSSSNWFFLYKPSLFYVIFVTIIQYISFYYITYPLYFIKKYKKKKTTVVLMSL
ncbi:unnamed protein product [Mucor circinelloides]